LKVHTKPNTQSIFPIVQGGLDPILRTESAKQLKQRNVNGYAIGGLRYVFNIIHHSYNFV
jgi:tRNA-guanine family transglycosylase